MYIYIYIYVVYIIYIHIFIIHIHIGGLKCETYHSLLVLNRMSQVESTFVIKSFFKIFVTPTFLFYPTANFGSLMRGQPHAFGVAHCILSKFDSKVTRSLITKLGP